MNDMLSELNGHLELSFVLTRLREAHVDKVSKLSKTVGTSTDPSESEDDDSESATHLIVRQPSRMDIYFPDSESR